MIISKQQKIPVTDDLDCEYIQEFLGKKVIRWAITSVDEGFYTVDCALEVSDES